MVTDNHDYGEQQKEDQDWHLPIEANWDKIEVDVEVRDVAANRGGYQPWDGAKFLATDTGERFVGDGTNWIDVDLTAPSVDTEQIDSGAINGDIWVDSPDAMADAVAALPNQGGTIRLKEGVYDDTDWTKTISIGNPTPNGVVTLDLSRASITLTSFAGPYIERPVDTTQTTPANTLTLNIYGPRKFDVNGVTNPGKVMHLWDIGNGGYLIWPHCFGGVEAIVHKRQHTGSGHMVHGHINGNSIKRGIVIGDKADNQTSDRCFWWGQLGDIQEVGVEVRYGQTNQFWVQPEVGPTGSIGYQMKYGANAIHNNHNKTDMAMDIQADTMITAPRHQGYDESLIASRPHGFTTDRVSKNLDSFFFDGITTGKYDSSNATIGKFGTAILDSGTTDGTVAHIGTPGRGGNRSNLGHFEIIQTQVDSCTIRAGAWDSASDWVALEKSPSDTNWQAVAVEGGVETVRQATSHAVNGSEKEITVGWENPNDLIRLGIKDVAIGQRYYDIFDPSIATHPTLRPRVWITTNGTPAAAQKVQLESFNVSYQY